MSEYIITVCVPTKNSNGAVNLIIDDLGNQKFKNFIVYFADGQSNDGTLEVINNIDSFRFEIVSKKDKSAEDAINKCLDRVNTKYFSILGSDDRIPENYLYELVRCISEKNADIVFPNVQMIFPNGEIINGQNGEIFDVLKYKMVSPGIGWIAKSKILKEIKGFSLNYKVASDYDFLSQAFVKGYKMQRCKTTTYVFNSGGNSNLNTKQGFKEVRDISVKNGLGIGIAYSYYYLRIVWHFFLNKKL